MTQRVLIHVGTPKSGTTYLQDLLWCSRPALAEAGVLFPGGSPADHFHAAVELGTGDFHGWRDPDMPGAWHQLVEAARAHPGTTVISHELFGDLSAEAAAQALRDLDFAEVHVVVTARDLARQLPAVWQEDLKNRHHLPFEEFLAVVRPGTTVPDVIRPAGARPEYHGAAFWLRQDVPAVLQRWGAGLPRDQVHVVTVPPRGSAPGLLWERFAQVLGVDPAIATLPPGRRNASLGAAESELLRRLNERLDYAVEWPTYGPRITHLMATALADRPHATPLTLPGTERAWVSAQADAMLFELAALGCDVSGDLGDLEVQPVPGAGEAPAAGTAELLDAALDAVVALIPTQQAHPEPPAPEPAAPEPAAEEPVAAVLELAGPAGDGPPPPLHARGDRSWRPWRRTGRALAPAQRTRSRSELVSAESPTS